MVIFGEDDEVSSSLDRRVREGDAAPDLAATRSAAGVAAPPVGGFCYRCSLAVNRGLAVLIEAYSFRAACNGIYINFFVRGEECFTSPAQIRRRDGAAAYLPESKAMPIYASRNGGIAV